MTTLLQMDVGIQSASTGTVDCDYWGCHLKSDIKTDISDKKYAPRPPLFTIQKSRQPIEAKRTQCLKQVVPSVRTSSYP